MDLRKKTLCILTGVIIGIIIIFMAISFTFFLDNYRKIEAGYITDYSNLVDQNVKNEMDNLDLIVRDWGAWDDTYAFVAGERVGYFQSNPGEASFKNLRLNFIIITNRQGDIMYGEGFDLEKNTLTPLRSDLVAELAREGSPLRNLVTVTMPSGFLYLPQGTVILSSYPVLRSDFTGPSRGVVIMGRYLSEAEVARLSVATQPKISIIPFEQASLSTYDRTLLSDADTSQVLVRTLDENTVEADRVIPDITENGKFLISIQMPRDIYQQGKRDILNFILLQLGIELIIGLITIWLLDSQVLGRLKSINSEIDDITLHKKGKSRVIPTGNDEITHLTLAMNRMLDQIDHDQKELRAREQRFREFAEQFPEVMLEADYQGRLTFINQIAYNKFGYAQGEIEKNATIYNFIAEEERARAQENFSRVLKGMPLSGSEYVMVKKDGSRFPVLLYSAPVIRDEKIVGVRIFAGDISARKQTENALLETNKKLNLLSSITRHDVTNQLLSLFGFMDLVEEFSFDPETRAYFNNMKQAAERIQQQIAFTKDYQDIGVKALQWQNVRQVIMNANGNHAPSKYRIRIDIHDVEIYADTLLERVFYNIVDNANNYGGNISDLRMSGKEIPEGFLITCEDDGVGIPYDKKEAIFNREYF
ncbi:MAG TPA: CHASE4 domain-containing protein, partial [Methanoregula sp.]|nr:CHASE4 domain-containing protein [Methanoregula sp.]